MSEARIVCASGVKPGFETPVPRSHSCLVGDLTHRDSSLEQNSVCGFQIRDDKMGIFD
jgi:hypothetical protein